MSSGTQRHQVKIFNVHTGVPVSQFEPYSGFLGDRSAPISATAFHPHRLLIAAAAMHDNHVNLFSCRANDKVSKTVKLWDGNAATRSSTVL
jgi:regulator-associated protein of mTOR